MRRYLIVQHVDYESPGVILDWLDGKGYPYRIVRPDKGEPFPLVDDFDRLIVMGGPMGADDEERFPWIKKEKELIGDFLSADKKVLGICLGAQIIARVLGAVVHREVCDEFGWKEVSLTPEAARSRYFYDFPPRFIAFHWHSDAFDIPAGALNPASTLECPNQVVETDLALGLQFHLEMTPQMVREAFRIMGKDQELTNNEEIFERMHRLMFKILERL